VKYLLAPDEYREPNVRIDGFRKLKEVNAKTVDISVFSQAAFDFYLEHRNLPAEFVHELETKANDLIESSFTHAAVVRRAFVVPGIANPPGPRFIGLRTSQLVVGAVRELYEFAISQGYQEVPDSQITGFLYPFQDPEPYDKENPNVLAIPYGGTAVYQSGSNSVEMYVVWGNNEGAQTLVADRYTVHIRAPGRFVIDKKEIPQKDKMYVTTRDSQNELVSVPLDLQFEQILADNQILEVTRVVSELSAKYGPQRVEFTADDEGIYFNEVADYWEEEADKEHKGNIDVVGVVHTINNVGDLEDLATMPKEDLLSGKIIVKIGKEIVASRSYDILGELAAWQDNLYLLYPGIAATQHAMRVLTDKGHKAFLIGSQRFDDGDKVQIIVSNGKVRISNLSRTQSQKYVSLWDASLLGVSLCGGKAERLSKMKVLGYQVPHGGVFTTNMYDDIVEKLGYKAPVVLEDFPAIYDLLKNPGPVLIEYVEEYLVDYKQSTKLFSVRSSATIEDASEDSMAGMFETFIPVKGEDLAQKVLGVIRSAFSPRIAKHLASAPHLTAKLKMAVVIQELVQVRAAGVIFGAKVQNGDLDVVEIEANEGFGEGIVSGESQKVEQYKFSRSGRSIIERKGPEALTKSEAKALFMLSERLRSEFNDVPQDVEWAIDRDGQIWVLQTRDLYIRTV
jgi:hypothetical protein